MSARAPEQEGRVGDIFSRAGAYRRFKDLLEHLDLLEAWYAHEEEAKREALTRWCRELGIDVTDDPPPLPDFDGG